MEMIADRKKTEIVATALRTACFVVLGFCFVSDSAGFQSDETEDLQAYFSEIAQAVSKLRSQPTHMTAVTAVELNQLIDEVPIDIWVDTPSLAEELLSRIKFSRSDAKRLLSHSDPIVVLATVSLISRFGKGGAKFLRIVSETIDNATTQDDVKHAAIMCALLISNENSQVLTEERIECLFDGGLDARSVDEIARDEITFGITFEATWVIQMLKMSGHTKSHLELFGKIARTGNFRARVRSICILGELGYEAEPAKHVLKKIVSLREETISELAGLALVVVTNGPDEIESVCLQLNLDAKERKTFEEKCHDSLRQIKEEDDDLSSLLRDEPLWFHARLKAGRGYEKRLLLRCLVKAPKFEHQSIFISELERLALDPDPVTRTLAKQALVIHAKKPAASCAWHSRRRWKACSACRKVMPYLARHAEHFPHRFGMRSMPYRAEHSRVSDARGRRVPLARNLRHRLRSVRPDGRGRSSSGPARIACTGLAYYGLAESTVSC